MLVEIECMCPGDIAGEDRGDLQSGVVIANVSEVPPAPVRSRCSVEVHCEP